MWEALQFEFMRNALVVGLLVSVACGVIGTLVVINRIAMISGGVAHAAYGGVGLAFFLGISPLLGASLFSLGSALIMGWFSVNRRHRADAVIGVVWALGMALGVILIDLSPGYNVDLMSYLFGSILSVGTTEIWTTGMLDAIILATTILFFKEFQAMAYDEEFAMVVCVPVKKLYFLLLSLVALSVVMMVRVVGLILVIALLTIPPYIAEAYTDSLGKMMTLACLLGALFNVAGLWISYTFDISSGASIILAAGAGFFISKFFQPRASAQG